MIGVTAEHPAPPVRDGYTFPSHPETGPCFCLEKPGPTNQRQTPDHQLGEGQGRADHEETGHGEMAEEECPAVPLEKKQLLGVHGEVVVVEHP